MSAFSVQITKKIESNSLNRLLILTFIRFRKSEGTELFSIVCVTIYSN